MRGPVRTPAVKLLPAAQCRPRMNPCKSIVVLVRAGATGFPYPAIRPLPVTRIAAPHIVSFAPTVAKAAIFRPIFPIDDRTRTRESLGRKYFLSIEIRIHALGNSIAAGENDDPAR